MSAASDLDESAYEDLSSAQSEGATDEEFERSASEDVDSKTRKRRKNGQLQPANVKRQRGLYRDEYRQLYNSTIKETTNYLPNGNPGALKPSQIGASRWTVDEKQLLFSAVEKHGKDNVPKIAAIIGTKSEPEIRDLLLLLQDGHAELHINAEYPRATSFHEIAAAHEISEDCCKSLESAADALARYQNSWDARQERTKHGIHWLLTSDMATAFDKALEAEKNATDAEDNLKNTDYGSDGNATGEQAQSEDSREAAEDELQHAKAALAAVPAARLLRLSKWFELSYRVFANAGGPRENENWHSIAEHDEEPGIFHTALADFHRLVVSVTQRLVAASLNQAMSRLRAKDEQRENKGSKPLVRRQDVLAALEILNMPQSSRSFWAKAPRRCGVIVQQKDDTIDYDEVERILQGELPSSNTASTDHRTTTIGGTSPVITNLTDLSESEEEDDHDASDSQETYAELFDRQQSNREEKKLWSLLGQNPPHVQALGKVELPKQPSKDRKTWDELRDWRDVVDFKAEWERYGKPISLIRPDSTVFSNTAQPEDALEPTQSPTPSDGTTSEELDMNSTPSPASVKVRRKLPRKEKVVEDDGSDYEGDAEPKGGTQPTNVPIRRVLAPRRARDAATSSMGELPPYPEEHDESSGDDYDGRA